MNVNQDELVVEALLGEEADKFLKGDLGRYLIGCAEQEIQEALLALETADPGEAKDIQKLQNRVWRARSFSDWLKELVIRGDNALKVYKQQQEE